MSNPAPAAKKLLAQATAAYPNRRKTSDGIVPSKLHTAANPSSDHEVGAAGYNHAVDLSHDPANGCDCGTITELIRQARDPRVRYGIFNKRIFSSYRTDARAPWSWGTYTGSSPHTSHCHISIFDTKAACENTSDWPGIKGGGAVSVCYGRDTSKGYIDTGAAVGNIQCKLMKLGYNLHEFKDDGDFGTETEAAVIAFQKMTWPSDKSQWDGVVGPLTMTALNAAYAKAIAPPVAPPLVTPPVVTPDNSYQDGVVVVEADADLIALITQFAKRKGAKNVITYAGGPVIVR